MKLRIITILTILLLNSTALFAQVNEQICYKDVAIPDTTDRYNINADGTVSDIKTGLMWQRCSVGQTYNVQTAQCDNKAQRLNWQEALRSAVNDKTAQYEDWQVPNIKELASILNHQCVTPSIDKSYFIGAMSDNYWSNTSGVSNTDSAWVYQFASGLNSLHAKTSSVYLRLVRYEK